MYNGELSKTKMKRGRGRGLNKEYIIMEGMPDFIRLFPTVVQVFDVTRKVTYKNLSMWYSELRQNRPKIPCLLVANKIDC